LDALAERAVFALVENTSRGGYEKACARLKEYKAAGIDAERLKEKLLMKHNNRRIFVNMLNELDLG
jgi:hypothetical protein